MIFFRKNDKIVLSRVVDLQKLQNYTICLPQEKPFILEIENKATQMTMHIYDNACQHRKSKEKFRKLHPIFCELIVQALNELNQGFQIKEATKLHSRIIKMKDQQPCFRGQSYKTTQCSCTFTKTYAKRETQSTKLQSYTYFPS